MCVCHWRLLVLVLNEDGLCPPFANALNTYYFAQVTDVKERDRLIKTASDYKEMLNATADHQVWFDLFSSVPSLPAAHLRTIFQNVDAFIPLKYLGMLSFSLFYLQHAIINFL